MRRLSRLIAPLTYVLEPVEPSELGMRAWIVLRVETPEQPGRTANKRPGQSS